MGKLEAAKYITAGVMNATIDGPILDCQGIEQLSFTGETTDVASPVGSIQVWGTNDPRARDDQLRGLSQSAGAAVWHQCDLPTGSAKKTGAGLTIGADAIALDGSSAGTFTINLVDPLAFMRLRYVHTSGGGTSDFLNVRREGR